VARGSGRRFTVGFDTEDDGRGNPFLWCFAHGEGRNSARTRGEALTVLENYVRHWKPRGVQVEVWTTNLEYDLCNTFDRDRVAEVTWYFGRSYLCSARWRGVDFRDTVRHLPASVEQLGTLVGAKKVHARLFAGRRPDPVRHLEAYRARCLRDATITYRTAKLLAQSYKALGVRPRTTLASTALAVWREVFWKREVRKPIPEVWNAAHAAYHGGRTQAFAVGTFPQVTVIDVASMFPWAMTTAPLPLPWGLVSRVPRRGVIDGAGVYHVRVRSQLARPQLPVRTTRGTVYPNGSWSGWYVGEELLAFLAAGGDCDVLSGFRFLESCRPFDGYVRSLFRRKQAARGLRRTLYKSLLTGLYGKFGQQGRKVRCVPVAKFLELERAPLNAREWNGLVIFQEDGPPPPWGNNVWPAFVTARARVRLAQEIRALEQRGARPLYCDTDSVMFLGNGGRYPERARRVGDFEMKGRFRRMLIVGKKEYALETSPGRWLAHVKGVPLLQRYRYLTEGTAEFDRPVKMREAANAGGTVNVWRRVKKTRRTDIRTGAVRPDGSLPAPVIAPETNGSGKRGS
jgi:hypothetical protein